MNKIKRYCALLLAIVLLLGVALQPEIGEVFAESTDRTDQSPQATTGSATESTTEPTAEPTTQPTAQPTTEPTIQPTAETKTEPIAEPATEPVTEPTTEPVEEPQKDEYIYFDLALGSVTIGNTSYSGKVNVGGETKDVSSTTRTGNEKFYVYQSTKENRSDTGYKTTTDYGNKTGCRVPAYPRVYKDSEPWTKFITNNIDVEGVSKAWDIVAAEFSHREPTENRIIFTKASGYKAEVTIDNIWSSYFQASTSRTTGGIGAHLDDEKNTTISLRLNGDNRVGCIHYSSDLKSGNQLIISNGDDSSKPGSITVADFQKNFKANHWNAVIGAADSPANRSDMSEGIVINGGYIYAGATAGDNCTAIGGGGNNYGSVTISGGTVTAVTAGTGTAIGGGIGFGSPGGNTDVIINDGTVYAYNLGLQKGKGDDFTQFLPAAAIGGGGSKDAAGGLTANITINGGTIYAQSMGGPGIGGGGSAEKSGGPANITITGGTIIAKSTGGTYGSETINPGVSIGGGTGKTGGGSVTLNISGNDTVLRTGSIGGGKTNGSGTIGSATVTISGGNITGQVIMAGTGSDPNKKCSFTMTDGWIHGTNVIDGNTIESIYDPQKDVPIQYLEKNGGAVWMEDPLGVTNISGGTIEGCTAYLGGAIYMQGGTFNLSGDGTIRNNTAIQKESNTVQGYGGGVYIAGGEANISGGTIEGCTAYLGGAICMMGGTFNLSGDGTIQNNTARRKDSTTQGFGYGGGVYVTGGVANINGGFVKTNKAQVRGGGLYVTVGSRYAEVNVTGGSIQGNVAGFATEDIPLPTDVGRGGGVYLEGGTFTMTGGDISGNSANYRGGGIFLTNEPELTAGIISGNTAKDSGGGVCINGDMLELQSPEMRIFGNTAVNGGGVAVLNGDFVLTGGAVGVEGEAPNKATNGGGVYVKPEDMDEHSFGVNTTITSGNIWYNEAVNGGGIYLAQGKGEFILEGENAFISHNTAKYGGGVYLYKAPVLNHGTIQANTATENGGGMYISDCVVTLNPTKDVTVTENHAKNGAGIYIHGSSQNPGGTENPGGVELVTSASPTQKVGLLVPEGCVGTVSFTNNIAAESGGAVCVDVGRFYLESDRITITGNEAKNGGGVAVLNGNFTITAGSVGEDNGANRATNGGGVYVSSGEVYLRGGIVKYNEATVGGGAYVIGGNLIMEGGSLESNHAKQDGGGFYVDNGHFTMNIGTIDRNTAVEKGGGGYVAGNFLMLDGTIGGTGNTAKDGGGIYVNEGNVEIVYGTILGNSATQDGGGFYISAADHSVDVLMLSGTLSGNQAVRNGGGMAVASNNAQTITVEIGCLENHDLVDGVPTLPISYDQEGYIPYAIYGDHKSCPQVKNNKAGSVGGGFYLNSGSCTLSFYCVAATGNTASRGHENSDGMDVEGGRVVIGDAYYHNHKHDDTLVDKHVVPWGYIFMDDATLVNGGQVDIYGDMTNPIFHEEVTVDIQDPDKDHFRDHRRTKDGTQYKVHYVENFFGTGTYQARQYDDSNSVLTIAGAIFSHPGYQMKGWYTKAEYDPTVQDDENRFYPVGETFDLKDPDQVPNMGQHPADCPYCGDDKDAKLLVLYAIWEANGYTVIFDPNVPAGETYTGSMEGQILNYGKPDNLLINQYWYPGHFFEGWNTMADGSGTQYTDGQEVSNLTNKNGETVVLYAQWTPCDHSDPQRWSYSVEDEKTLVRDCSCGGQTLTATLHGLDTVYDGDPHPATLTFSDEAAWGEDKPTIAYTAAWLEDGLDHEGESPALTNDGKPFHAGVYTASITKPDGNPADKKTASLRYTIHKADQPAPAKPTYEISGDNMTVTINRLGIDPNVFTDRAGNEHRPKAEYCLTYHGDSNVSWETMDGTTNELKKTFDTALTNYIVQARYQELEDYNASDITRAEEVYFFEGDVSVKIRCDEGIRYEVLYAVGTDTTSNGVTLTFTIKTGYYLVGGVYDVETELEPFAEGKPAVDTVNNICKITDIPNGSTLTITIGKTKLEPQVARQVTPGQVFSPFTGVATTISRDSAFTAAFQIGNYDPSVYTGLELTFDDAIPENTTMILLDRRDGTYWHYRANAAVSSVALTEFKRMGGTGTHSISQSAEGYLDLNYQVIVDFSQSAGYSKDSLTMHLKAPAKPELKNVPVVDSPVTVSMKTPTFSFSMPDNGNSLTHSFTCAFHVEAAASKWENRASALVLKPTGETALPSDARIKAEVNNKTVYLYKSGGQFIVPLSLLQAEGKTVTLTLQSDLFPSERETVYSFAAQWLISPSKAGKAPMVGDQAGETLNVTFTSAEIKAPSLKTEGVDGQSRILTSQDTLVLHVSKMNMEGYTISAALLGKAEDGNYVGTGKSVSLSGDSVSVALAGQKPGSFCLMLTVKRESDLITIVMEVPYYFIIKETQ